ncbi:hypothetical protein [Bradyrhizobium sp. 2TAF24]|uniref:hypothetical protein n=1 Tax=Bradyrhizobium sp. 2TAF24 TaxID=3233011 RepID=UPI003F903029
MRLRAWGYLGVFGVVAVYFLIWPAWRAQFPLEIWPTEGWNAYYQDMGARWLSVYPKPDALIVNNYPPLSFYAIGQLANLFGDALYVGRALSIVGLLAVAVEIALAARLLGASLVWGGVGGLSVIAVMAHNFLNYVGADDPQLAGQAVMGAALVWFLARQRAGRSSVGPLLLMVLAGFWKHNMIAIPVTAVLWLLVRDGRKALAPVAISGAAALGGLVVCRLVFGPDFLANLLTPRSYNPARIIQNVGHLQWQAAGVAITALWAVANRRSDAARFTTLFMAVGLASCLLQWCGDAVFQNAEYDLVMAVGIGTALALDGAGATVLARRWSAAQVCDGMVIVLLLRLLLTNRHEPALVLFSPDFRATFVQAAAVTRQEAARVAALPGAVSCDNKVLCRMAGKPFVVDEFKLDQMLAKGVATPAVIDEMLAARGISRFAADRRSWAYGVTQVASGKATAY